MFNNIYEVKVTGRNTERFLNYIIKRNIYLLDVKYQDKSIYIKLDYDNYQKLINIKTSYDIELTRMIGINKIKDLVKRHYIFVLFLIFGFFFLILLTRIIMEVEVVHSKEEIRDIIYKDLDKYGIKKYHFILSYDDKEKVATKIMENHKDKIEWLEIERVGVKYIVKVEERVIKSKKKENPIRHIVAKKDAIITSIEASRGEIVKKKNDYVKEGDVIISGNILKKDEIKQSVSATGKVLGEVWYQVEVDMPLHYKETIRDTKSRKNITINFLNKEFSFLKKYKTKETTNIFSIGNKLLPISINYVKEVKTKEIDEVYNYAEAVDKALVLSEEKLTKKLDKDSTIIKRKKLKTELNGSTINVKVFFKVMEDITEYKTLTIEDIKKEQAELKEKQE